MCGIAGFIDAQINYDPKVAAKQMADTLYSRGPDSFGLWQDNNFGINLLHRRLAILDLTAAGHQPMISDCGRYVMVFNGEIYNFKLLRQQLDSTNLSISWRGHSDSEVILQGFVAWGIEETITKCEGMFAIALWDRETEDLYLIRDRMGEKPLYYGYLNGAFAFASELKALRVHPKFMPNINRDALGQLLLHNCIPAPLSIYQGIWKLLPARILKLSLNDIQNHNLPNSYAYWNLSDSLSRNYTGTIDNAIGELDNLLHGVIRDQMIADVPLGCFLSGGVDSSLIASIMQNQSSKPIETFCIGFDQPEYDEAVFAKEVARHLGSNHHELYITEKDAQQVIPKLSQIYDEPFSDSSQIPTYLVSKLAKTKVTVSLSGDAGDELFAGYNRYILANKAWAKFNKIPLLFNKPFVKATNLLSSQKLEFMNWFFKFSNTNFSHKFYKLSALLQSRNFAEFYLTLMSHWLNFAEIVKNNKNSSSYWIKECHGLSNIETMMFLDSLGYLPDDILVKVDRASMANSLESRVPFLNHKIVEFANSLPLDYKIRDNTRKYILREVLYKYVPKNLIERPKKGFGIPINQWLRGNLKDWAIDLLDSSKLHSQGYFNTKMISCKLDKHLNGTENNGYYLWDILMFQQWLQSQKNYNL